MCITPIKIRNNNKYITENNGHRAYIWVNCGKCSECIKQKQLEWNLRCYYQCLETLEKSKNNYIYFDTLTYRNEDLPRLSKLSDTNENWACFNYKHIRSFYETLRQKLRLKKDDKIKYFITSEYGDIKHRPHYHIMIFVEDTIEPIKLSKIISESWKYGRTDGIPYKSKRYVQEHNVIKELNIDAVRYIAKYVNKSQLFMDIINKRWNRLEKFYNKSKYNKLQIKTIKRQYYRLCTPFHRQSRNFGIKAIENISIEELIENPILYYRDNTIAITKKVHLPMYFYRKLFQEQIKYNGKRIWINNEQGIKYKEATEARLLEQVKDKLSDKAATKGIKISNEQLDEIADYILFKRGRLKGKEDYRPHHKEATLFNYNTDKDLQYLGKKTISKTYAGNDKIGYITTNIDDITDYEERIYTRNDLEAIIARLNESKDNLPLVRLKEHMAQIRKIFFANY